MKRRFPVIIIFFVLSTFFIMLSVHSEEGIQGKIVCIDPGHQLHWENAHEPIGPGAEKTKPCVSSGTRGKIAGWEHEVNLDVGLRLHEILTKKGIVVVMTRVIPDVHLCNSERARIANRAGADLFIRLHCNAGKSHSSFTLYPAEIEGWTDDIYEESKKAAEIVQKAYAEYTGIPSDGIRSRKDISGFNWSDVPVILPEMLHMQNESDDQLASTPEFRQKMAEGLANGIIAYLKSEEMKDKPEEKEQE